MNKRLIITAFVFLICCLLASCMESEQMTDPSERTNVYRLTKIEWPEFFGADISELVSGGGRIFVKGWDTEHVIRTETGYLQDQMLFSVDAAGGTSELLRLKAADGYDKIASIVYSDDGERFETLTKLSEKSSFERVTVRHFDANGTLLAEYECGELFGIDISKLRMNLAGEGGFFVRRVIKEGGETIIVSNTGAAVLDKKGERRLLIESRDEIADAAYEDGKLLLIYEKNGTYSAKPADLVSGEVGEKLQLPERFDTSRKLQLFGLDGYDIAVRDDDGVWGLTRTEDGGFSETLLCSFADSDIVGSSIQSFAPVNADVFFAAVWNQVTDENALYRMEMIPRSELVEKETLTVGSLMDADYYAHYAAVDFNLASETHRIVMKTWDYTLNDNGSWNTDAAVQSFELDIVSGEVPDILIGSCSQLEKYIDKGLYCDLYTLMDESERENFLEPVLSYGERDGKLYFLPVHALIETIYTAKDISEWTLEGAMDLLESLGEGEAMITPFGADRFASLMLTAGIGDFVDASAGTVKFDTPTFRRFAELYKKLSAETAIDWEAAPALTVSNAMTQPSKMARQLAEHGEKLEFVGWPSADGGGTLFSPSFGIAVSSKCADREAAWEFIKIRLSDAYLRTSSGLNAPLVTHSAFENWCAENEGAYYFVMDKSIRIFRDNATLESAGDLGAGKLVSDEEYGIVDTIRALVMSAKPVGDNYAKVMNIVYEELYDYVGKNLSTDELVRRIESRAGIYVSEQS